jgi:hypothetical protein
MHPGGSGWQLQQQVRGGGGANLVDVICCMFVVKLLGSKASARQRSCQAMTDSYVRIDAHARDDC